MIKLNNATIRQMVLISNRCHITDSNKKAIKTVINTLKNKLNTWFLIDKKSRKKAMRAIIKEHKNNLELYIQIHKGF